MAEAVEGLLFYVFRLSDSKKRGGLALGGNEGL